MIEIFILALIQGITEFLPVSSSSHLIIFSNYLNFQNESLTIDVCVHIGSFFAVLAYFHKDIFNFIENKKLLIKIVLSSIPVMILGFLLVQTNIIQELRNLKIIGWTTIIFGILLFISDKFNLEKSIEKNFSFQSAIIIGLFK